MSAAEASATSTSTATLRKAGRSAQGPHLRTHGKKHAVRHRSGTAKGAGPGASRRRRGAQARPRRSAAEASSASANTASSRKTGPWASDPHLHAHTRKTRAVSHQAMVRGGSTAATRPPAQRNVGDKVACASIETGSSSSRKRSVAGLTCEQKHMCFCGVQAVCQCSAARGEADGVRPGTNRFDPRVPTVGALMRRRQRSAAHSPLWTRRNLRARLRQQHRRAWTG